MDRNTVLPAISVGITIIPQDLLHNVIGYRLDRYSSMLGQYMYIHTYKAWVYYVLGPGVQGRAGGFLPLLSGESVRPGSLRGGATSLG